MLDSNLNSTMCIYQTLDDLTKFTDSLFATAEATIE